MLIDAVKPAMRDRPVTGDHHLITVVLFDILVVKYTSDKRPPLLKDHFLMGWSLVAGFTVFILNKLWRIYYAGVGIFCVDPSMAWNRDKHGRFQPLNSMIDQIMF